MIDVMVSDTTTAISTAIASREIGATKVISSGMLEPTANEMPGAETGEHRSPGGRDLVDPVLGLELGGERVGGVQLLGHLLGQVRGQPASDVVLGELGQLVVGVGREQPLLVRDGGQLRVTLGRRFRPLGPADTERTGDRGGQGGGDQQLITGARPGEAFEQAGGGDDAVVRLHHPALDGRTLEPGAQATPHRRPGTRHLPSTGSLPTVSLARAPGSDHPSR